MEKRDVVGAVIAGQHPPYVPWSFQFTQEAREKLEGHFGRIRVEESLQNHIVNLGLDFGLYSELGNDRWQDHFGAVWNRTADKDVGVVEVPVLKEPTLKGYEFPDPLDERFFENIPTSIEQYPDRFRLYQIGFSLYERAWILRGMENLMMDFYDHPQFVRELFNTIGEYNIARVNKAVKYNIDAVHFGDDWGQQHGLQMGYPLWKEFIYPVLKRQYAAVKEAGKYVFIHSCGDVDELFDDLVDLGLNCFNPFQPEVMNVCELMKQYRGRLAFFGGLSTQKTLPYGSPEEVQRQTRRLIEMGRVGGLILSPAHSVEGDVPLENMLALIETVKEQEGYVPGQ